MTFNLEIAAESMRGGVTSRRLFDNGIPLYEGANAAHIFIITLQASKCSYQAPAPRGFIVQLAQGRAEAEEGVIHRDGLDAG